LFGLVVFEISGPKVPENPFSGYFHLRRFGPKSVITFWRGVRSPIPLNQDALGLGEHRLQSLSTFYNVAKKLEQIFGKKIGI
jgi:hypothetical protein